MANERRVVRKWLPWWPGDYLRDTMTLSIEEDLFYRRLIDALWMAGGCLPSDREAIRRAVRYDIDAFARCEWILGRYCEVGDDGMLRQPRLSEEFEAAAEAAAKASEKARRAAAARSPRRPGALLPDDLGDRLGDRLGGKQEIDKSDLDGAPAPSSRENGDSSHSVENCGKRNIVAPSSPPRSSPSASPGNPARSAHHHHQYTLRNPSDSSECERSLAEIPDAQENVRSMAPKRGVMADFCAARLPQLDFRAWFDHFEAAGWVDRDGRDIRPLWKHKAAWCARDAQWQLGRDGASADPGAQGRRLEALASGRSPLGGDEEE